MIIAEKMNPDHGDIYPLNPRFLAMDNVHELNLQWWLNMAAYTVFSDNGGQSDERYAYTKVREARDARIFKLLAAQGIIENSPGFWQYFHGYVTDVQRVDWEQKSGQPAILPSA